MRTIIVTLVLSILFISIGHSQTTHRTEIAETVESYIDQSGFSGTILVAHKGSPIFHESYGLAYYSNPDSLRNWYHYSIASITKLFTSIRILQLAENGSLKLNKSITSYLPQYDHLISEKVTIHHLLLHISGLPQEQDDIYRHPGTPHVIVRHILEQQSAHTFESFNYNNVDYMLLGLVIETLSKNSWEGEIKKFILSPLGMDETGFLEYGYYPNNFAYSYSKKWYGLKQDPLFYIENFFAAGRMYSTTGDLLKLDQAIYSNSLLTGNSLKLLSTSYPEYNYAGYGVWNYSYPFIDSRPNIMERRGKILGANVVLVRMTDDNYTIIILSNDNRFNPDSFGDPENLREMLIQTLYQENS